jgi:hypothetical protein
VGQPRAVTVFLYFYAVLQLGYVGFNFKPSNAANPAAVQSASAASEQGTPPIPSHAPPAGGSPAATTGMAATPNGPAVRATRFPA